jgi:superfamily I DNA/RNA helicase
VERQRLLDGGASQTRLALHDDRTASRAAIMTHCQTPEDVFAWLGNLYSRGKGAVTLSTVHRAKGLEAERVILLRPDLLPLAVLTIILGWTNL